MVSTDVISRVLELAVMIQRIPAPTFEERQRSAFINEAFSREGLLDVHIDEVGNVYGRLPGGEQDPGKPLIVTAHTDTVFPALTDVNNRRESDKIYGPGIGDNSLGVAGLFGLLWALKSDCNDQNTSCVLPKNVWFVANVCEEGLGDLKGMKAVVDCFGEDALAYVVVEGMALGHVYHRGLGVRRYRITTTTAGGHSWVDFGRPSAIHELANLVTRLAVLPLSTHPRTTLNVGVISGGFSVNTIAPEAHLELDLRSESPKSLEKLVQQVEDLVRSANRPGVQVTREIIGSRPAGKILATHPLVQLAGRCLQEVGVHPHLSIGSTDANVPLSRGLPAVCIGLSTGSGAHTLEEYINITPLRQGLSQLVCLVQGICADGFGREGA